VTKAEMLDLVKHLYDLGEMEIVIAPYWMTLCV
jgi:hypothetical protein